MQPDVFLGGEVQIQARALEDDAHASAHVRCLCLYIVTRHANASGGWAQRRSEYRDRGGLPRAVGTQEREEFARSDLEGHTVDRVLVSLAIALHQVPDLDRRAVHVAAAVSRRSPTHSTNIS